MTTSTARGKAMKTLFFLTFISIAALAAAQTPLPMGVPDLCALPGSTIIPAGRTERIDGARTENCLGVHGALLLGNGANLTVTTLIVYPDGLLDTVEHPGRNITITIAD